MAGARAPQCTSPTPLLFGYGNFCAADGFDGFRRAGQDLDGAEPHVGHGFADLGAFTLDAMDGHRTEGDGFSGPPAPHTAGFTQDDLAAVLGVEDAEPHAGVVRTDDDVTVEEAVTEPFRVLFGVGIGFRHGSLLSVRVWFVSFPYRVSTRSGWPFPRCSPDARSLP